MPIGSLTCQFFANVYLNELDQFVKHTLKVRGYLRYVNDFVLLADDPRRLLDGKASISRFLQERLALELHPDKTVLQRCNQRANVLGNSVLPDHLLMRQRTVRSLKRQLSWLKSRIAAEQVTAMPPPAWQHWLAVHRARLAPGVPSPAPLHRMLSTINSDYGLSQHADTYRLRRHLYHQELEPLRTFSLPDGRSIATCGPGKRGCRSADQGI